MIKMDLRYPIGPFEFTEKIQLEMIEQWISDIEVLPTLLKQEIDGLSEKQLDTPYREGGWTVRQVVHHLADSHLNGYLRVRLALTEDEPTILTYDENKWAALPDATGAPVSLSIHLLTSIHARWIYLIKSISAETLKGTYRNPEMGILTLAQNLELYAWHGKHHVAHITTLKKRMNW
ncbi:putative metal-dependent hydrolase [Hazenella sp. IB182353]|nr:putative metal-dependent hydrolase [Polycladospora coralii]